MKKSLTALACILSCMALSAQEISFSQYFIPQKKYLMLPVKNGAPKRNVELWVDGVNTRYFDIELADSSADWYAYLQIDQWKGKNVELRLDKPGKNLNAFAPIRQSDADGNPNMYQEKLRGQIHFSPKFGWTNDPNGLVYFNGEYHMFYQHNPYGRGWGNMTWGHAVSKDLVHWQHLDDALHPDFGGPVFSGGAVVDSANTSGLGKYGQSPMVMFHTGARGWGQYLSWSTDGRSFYTLDHAVVPRINKENRDPKVIWHAPTNKWVMVLWVERGDSVQHTMQLLTSPDLINWTEASTIAGGKGDDRYLFECPEFYELQVDGQPGVKKWVLTGANAQYAIGSFDGTTFTPQEERLQNMHGRDFYAAQTFSNEPHGRRIEIGWWRTFTASEGMAFNQSMSIPMEHKLIKTPGGIRLTRTPIKELEILRTKNYRFSHLRLSEGSANPLKKISAELVELQIIFNPEKAKKVNINVRGVDIVYDAAESMLTIDSVKAPVKTVNGKIKLVLYADRTGIELFANDGLVFMPVNINIENNNRQLSVSSSGGVVTVDEINVYELKSIWQ